MDNRNMINHVFSQKILHQIAIKNKSDVVDEAYDFYIQGLKNVNVIQRMKSLYNYLKKSYRNEYFYKNTMSNRPSLGLYPVNITITLSEISIGNNIANFILLNDKGVVYEIKAELDKLDRLDNRTNDYYEVFNYVMVTTNNKHLNKVVAKYKNTTVGILALTSRNILNEVRKPKENNSLLNSEAMYNFLRKEERKRVIAQNHMDVLVYNDLTEYDMLFDVFEEIPMTKPHNSMISESRERGNIKEYKDEFLVAPTEIKSLLCFTKMIEKDKNKLYHFPRDTSNPLHFI